jgi:hypothetical protein
MALPVSGAATGHGGRSAHALVGINLWRPRSGPGHPHAAQILYAPTVLHRHLAVNSCVRGRSADSDVIRSGRVLNVKVERGPVAF